MPWLQLRINAAPDQAILLEVALQDSGAMAITLEDDADQPIFEPALGETPLWRETRVTALYSADIDTEQTIMQVRDALPAQAKSYVDSHRWHILEDKDWEREWIKNYHPIQCGENFWICPSWTAPPVADAVNLRLDPGLAFGTGTHPTTHQCVSWLTTQDLRNKTVIDYGCGSGILGLACLLLGAERVIGIDIDPQALLATRENVRRNGFESDRFPVYLPKSYPSQPVDLVMANILAGPLVELAPTLLNLLKPEAKICLSGILDSQLGMIEHAYSSSVEIESVESQAEWLCVTGRKSITATDITVK